MTKWRDLFTPRQLLILTTLSDLIIESIDRIKSDALATNSCEEGGRLSEEGNGATAYAESVAMIESLVLDKLADYNNNICTWNPTNQNVGHLFTKHAIPMAWDFTEASPLAGGLSISSLAEGVASAIESLPALLPGRAFQHDCASPLATGGRSIIATDPPYYDNIGYADLSDFFYVWQRRTLQTIFPQLFSTVVVPKAAELIAAPSRHGSKRQAEAFFLEGMTKAMHCLAKESHPAFPVTIYYAFKQSETTGKSTTASTGWETFLAAVIQAGFEISGTWPLRTERKSRAIGIGTNALASSIILVCRPRPVDAPTATRREFVVALQRELPEALQYLQAGNIAPVDLAQTAIGPGMSVFTRYARVLDAQGTEMSVREALILINETLDTALTEQEGDFDGDSRWALAWFEQYAFAEGEYGVAEILSKAKNTSISGLADAGILVSARGKVRLLRPNELAANWDPLTDKRLTVWEMVHHLIRVLAIGEPAAAELVGKLGVRAETARELAYRLYTIAERKKRAAEALDYNGLVQSWPDLVKLAQEQTASQPVVPQQAELL